MTDDDEFDIKLPSGPKAVIKTYSRSLAQAQTPNLTRNEP